MNPKERLQFVRQAELNPGLAMLTLIDLINKSFKDQNTSIAQELAKIEAAMPEKIVTRYGASFKGDPGASVDEVVVVERIKNAVFDLIDQPQNGHTPTQEELVALIQPLIPKIENGHTPTQEELLALIVPLIPMIEAPKPPSAEELISLITPIVQGMMKEKFTLEQVIERIKADPTFTIDASRVTNLPKIKKNGKYLHGGGDTVIAGTGVTITTNAAGQKVIAASSGITEIAITGTINDSNLTFTAASQPTYLVINGGKYKQTGGSITWTYVAGIITLSTPVGTGGQIWGE